MARTSLGDAKEAAAQSTPSKKTLNARAASQAQWLEELDDLRNSASSRFGDIAWSASDGSDLLWSHKAILYARSTAGFLAKYLQGYPAQTPLSASSSSLMLSVDSQSALSRSVSPAQHSMMSITSTIRRPLALDATDKALLEAVLEYLYTSRQMSDAYDFFFAPARQTDASTPVERLREDLLFMWRAKLYSDAQIQICQEDEQEPSMESESIFTVHRSILCSRVPYFKSLLLSPYADSENRLFTLPSPPFTNASLHFTLGYIYTGTLYFANRTFDLATAFNIWRCAAYLGMDNLLLEVEAAIEDLSVNQTKPDSLRCARVYQFACAPDVGCTLLAQLCRPFIANKFGDAWREEIGTLDQETQQKLVTDVCATIGPGSAVEVIRQIQNCQNKIALVKAPWAHHITAMLQPVEMRLKKMIGKETPEVVSSKAFVGLLEGRTFSSDILEKVLLLIVEALEERFAAKAYQAIVGNVLLREDGIPMDARVYVEECRQSIVKYLKNRWLSTRSMDGFADLEPWALKELADELDVKPDDLLQVESQPPTPTTRTGLRVTARKSNAAKEEPLNLRDATLNRNAARLSKASIRNSTASESGNDSSRPASSAILSSTIKPRIRTASSTSSVASTSSRSKIIPPERKNVASKTPAYGSAPSITSNVARHSGMPSLNSSAPSVRSVSASASPASVRPRATRLSDASSFRSRSSLAGPTSITSIRSNQDPVPRPKAGPSSKKENIPSRPPSSTSVRSFTSTKSTASKATTATTRSRKASEGIVNRPPLPGSSRIKATDTNKPALSKNGTITAKKPIVAKKSNSSIRTMASVKSIVKASETNGGTTLNVGISCIVTLPVNQKGKAQVFYLGPVPRLGAGQWVGVQMDDGQDVKLEAGPEIHLTNGKVKGIDYFKSSENRGLFLRPQHVMFLF